MLLIAEIGLSIWAWKRGWKAWVLLPFGVLLLFGILLVVNGAINYSNLWTAIFLDLALITALICMGIKPRQNSQSLNIKHSGQPVELPVIEQIEKEPSIMVNQPICNQTQEINRSDYVISAPVFKNISNDLIIDSKANMNRQCDSSEIIKSLFDVQPKTVSINMLPRLTFPDNTEIFLTEPAKIVGRSDFDKIISAEDLKYISRNHILIKFNNGKYFLEDLHSTNGTKVNDIEINSGNKSLDSGDHIQIAGKVEVIFNN